MKNKKTLAAILAICLFITSITVLKLEPSPSAKKQQTALHKELTSLSEEESVRLREFFEYHFFFSDFAYTLFGTKPMSIGRLLSTENAKKGWEAWEKIRGSFNSKEFIIRKYIHNNHEFILVANLKNVEEIYLQNQAWFNQAFQNRITFDDLTLCLKNDGPLFQQLMKNHLLIGILLGYGAHNAELFAKNQILSNDEKIPLEAFSYRIHPIFYIFSKAMPISFACDPTTDETKELKLRYAKERKEILQMAKNDSLFAQMIVKLSKGDE